MTSKRETVIAALVACVASALPAAKVERNPVKPERLPAGGFVAIRDGEPGEPAVMLSPLTYIYEHRIELEVVAGSTGAGRSAALDTMLRAIGQALAADRTLGGLCDWIEPQAPVFEDIEAEGTAVWRAAILAVVATYATSDPLG
jgi:hypothetical protein